MFEIPLVILFEMFKKDHRKLDVKDNATLTIFTRENIFIQLQKQQGKCVFLRESLPPDIQCPIDLVAELCLCLLVSFFRHENVDKFIDNGVTTTRPTKEEKIQSTIPQTRILKDDGFIRAMGQVTASSSKVEVESFFRKQHRQLEVDTTPTIFKRKNPVVKPKETQVAFFKGDGFVGSVNKVTASVYKAEAKRHREIVQTVAAKKRDKRLTRTEQKHCEGFYGEAQNSAAMAFFSNNFSEQSEDYTLNLHNFYVREAIEALDIFLDKEISALKNKENQTNQEVIIITGRGIHSPEGRPKIKPKVKERLDERELDFEENESNSGRVHVWIYKDSLFTTELNIK